MVRCKNTCSITGDNLCCRYCNRFENCEDACGSTPEECEDAIIEEESGLELFQEVNLEPIAKLTKLMTEIKRMEAESDELRDNLKAAMEKYNVKKFEGDGVTITYIEPTTRTSVDSTKLKKKYPDIAEECSKVSNVSASVRISLK